MHWKEGTTRVVLVIPALGICLKFARVRPWEALVGTVRAFRARGVQGAVRYWQHSINGTFGGRVSVFRGIRDNWRERCYSVSRNHPVLARTYLSLGILNLQEMVAANPLDTRCHLRRLETVVGSLPLAEARDWHAFTGRNFGIRRGKAVVVDYAGLPMQKILDEYADKIHEGLDLVSPP